MPLSEHSGASCRDGPLARTRLCLLRRPVQRISKTGCFGATAAHSSSVASGLMPSKNLPVLELPAAQVGPQDRHGLGRRDLGGPADLAAPAQDQHHVAVGVAHVAHPLGLPPGRHQVLGSVRVSRLTGVWWSSPLLRPRCSSTREPQTLTPRRVRPGDRLVEDVGGEPVRALVVGGRPGVGGDGDRCSWCPPRCRLFMNIDLKSEQCSCQVLVFSDRNGQTGAHASAVRTTHGPGAGPGGDDRGDPRRGPGAPGPGRCRRPLLALHRPRPGHGPLGPLPVLRRARRPSERPDPRRLRVPGRQCAEAGRRPGRTRRGVATPSASLACPGPSGAGRLARPHEWGLIFGTPVPGYEAPEDTVVPYARIAAAMVRPVVEAEAAGRLRRPDTARPCPPSWPRPWPR